MLTILLGALLLVVVPAFANAIILWGIARLLKAPKPGIRSAFFVAAVNPIVTLLTVFGLYFTYERSTIVAVSIIAVGGLAAVMLPLFLIRSLIATGWGKSLAVYFAWGICGAMLNLTIAFAVRAFAQESYYVPTSAMAPTVVGVHRLGTCPYCGERMFVSTPLEPDGRPMTQNKQGICAACWRFDEANQIGDGLYFGDRIITSKLQRPKRWDIVTYYPPVAPEVLYTHRLVGLPGESVLVKDGRLWINGLVQPLPPGLEQLTYAGSKEMVELRWFGLRA